jgi:coniferyl-aldehyde dehydrogenase
VTLELGGKSPVLIGRSAELAVAAERIAVGKGLNGGQLCVSPDVIWVPEESLEPFIAALGASYERLYPSPAGNPDVVPIVNERHERRIEGYVADAAARGARVRALGSYSEPGLARRKPLRIVTGAPEGCQIASHEIFGPVCLLRGYRALADAVAAVNAGPRPLALYYFGSDEAERDWVLDHTISGGVSVNDVVMHPAVTDAPFGGIGASGMGHYHGREGFLEFSHARTVYIAGQRDPRREWGMLPPYTEAFAQMLAGALTP